MMVNNKGITLHCLIKWATFIKSLNTIAVQLLVALFVGLFQYHYFFCSKLVYGLLGLSGIIIKNVWSSSKGIKKGRGSAYSSYIRRF